MLISVTTPIRVALFALCVSAFAQQPVIATGGIVNAASYSAPIAPGSIISIFGTNLANTTVTASNTPLLTTLGGTTVSIDGVPAPLFYVSPSQINAEVPASIPTAYGSLYATTTVIVTTAAGSSAPVTVAGYSATPGVFTADGSGCGAAAALNVASDGTVSLNSPANSAAPGDFVVLFGTGFGQPLYKIPDGSPSGGLDPFSQAATVTVDGESATLAYGGFAPTLTGVDQMNVMIAAGTRDGCAVPISVFGSGGGSVSPAVSISVHSTRGQCIDPPSQSYGSVSLTKTVASGTSTDGETDTLTASFPSGPLLTRPVVDQTGVSGGYYANFYTPPVPRRSCPVAGYVPLSAGTIRVAGPNGSATASPSAYSQNLAPGFIAAGTYAVSAAGGATAGSFQSALPVSAPIQITSVTPGTITQGPNGQSATPFTVSWTGGGPNDVVKLSLISPGMTTSSYDYNYVPASVGSFHFDPICTGHSVGSGGNGVFCSWGMRGTPTELVIEQMPATAQIATTQASGITGNIQITWTYRFVYGFGN